MFAANVRWKIGVLAIAISAICGCGPTRLVGVPEILDPPNIPLDVGVYIAPNVRHQTATIGVVNFDIGRVLVTAIDDQCRRTFHSVRDIPRFPWGQEEVKGLDLVGVVDQPLKIRGWISGPTMWTAEGSGTVSTFAPSGQRLLQITKGASVKLIVGFDGRMNEVCYEGQRLTTEAVVSQYLHALAQSDVVRQAIAAKLPAEIPAGERPRPVAEVSRPVLPPPAVAEPSGNRYAVVIGINSYGNPQIPPLKYAVSDARAVYELLTARAAFPSENAILLLGDQATQREIRSALGTFLARKVLQNDTVLIFYAGHGAPETDYSRQSSDGYVKYIVPYDADPNDLFATAIPMSEISTFFSRIESQRVVFLSDACYSGAAGGRSFIQEKFRGVKIGDPVADLVRGRGRVIITAGDANEPAVEDPALGHGVFTYYLLEGLSGDAADGNGQVTLHGLYRYLSDRVTRKSKELGGNQHPVMKGEIQGDILLVPAR